MFSIKLTISIPDLDRHWIEIPCARCRLETAVTLGEVRLGGFTICRGCHANVHLVDDMASYHRIKRRFENIFSRFGR